MSIQKTKLDKASRLANEIIEDFVMISRESPEEINIADNLMALRNLLDEINLNE